MNGADDQALLRSSAAGDRGAFERFVLRHQAPVFRYLRSMAPNEADAEDALQEAFVRAWRSAGTYRGGASARGWILTVARNAVRRSQRRRAGEPASFETVESLGLSAGWGEEQDVLEGLARRDLLRRALGSLPDEDREILVLRELEGFSGDEVADVLGITSAAMKSRLHRARLRLVVALREVAHG
jgi:RNA polymerase sigma-70 factor (ECF subfamily)